MNVNHIEKIETPEGDGNTTLKVIFHQPVHIEKIETPEGDGNGCIRPIHKISRHILRR